MLEKAQHILKNGSVEEIMDFLPEIIQRYCEIDKLQAEKERNFDLKRISEYVRLKNEKKDKKNRFSDKDIDVISKNAAQKDYWDYNIDKRVSYHYKMYIEELRNHRIALLGIAKNLKDTV